LWDDALQHCGNAIKLASSLDGPKRCFEIARFKGREQRSENLSTHITLIRKLIQEGAFTPAENELKTAWSIGNSNLERLGTLSSQDEKSLTDVEAELAAAKGREWPSCITPWLGLRNWLPGVVTQTLRILSYLSIALLLWFVLRAARGALRGFGWRNVREEIHWSVSSVADETKQLAAGAVMDALNVYYNPLFQPLPTSSLLAIPPALTDRTTDRTDTVDPSYFVWRNFLIDVMAKPRVREYLSDLIEEIELEKFTRHTFKQVNAFEDINLKLGLIETSLGAVLRNGRNWWTKGWPTVAGSVVVETIGKDTFASVRLIANYGLRKVNGQEWVAPSDRDIKPEELFSGEKTLAVFASTKVDQFTDAVALAAQRAAFRLLYRLAKRPAEPNLAISASSYRQGLKMLTNVL
jgi:hypothetical protein